MNHIVGIGNYGATFGTEPARKYGYEDAGFIVTPVSQEEAHERGPAWFLRQCRDEWHPDAVTYARTHNNTALGHDWNAAWDALKADGVTTFTTHLDLFRGLPERERWVEDGDPMFRTEYVFTADGSCPEWWAERGVNHHFLAAACDDRHIPAQAEPFPELANKVIFVGSVGYHPEYPGRIAMLDFARQRWGADFIEIGNGTAWGPRRGYDLARVYASDAVFIGDSCFAGDRRLYASDRLFETLGRGGVLAMARALGFDEWFIHGGHLYWWDDFDNMAERVEYARANPETRREISRAARKLVLAQHTYRHRAREVLTAIGVEVPSGDD